MSVPLRQDRPDERLRRPRASGRRQATDGDLVATTTGRNFSGGHPGTTGPHEPSLRGLRRSLGSYGISWMVHVVVAILLFLIVIDSDRHDEELVTTMGFDTADVTAPELTEVSPLMSEDELSSVDTAQLIAQAAITPPLMHADATPDFAAFGAGDPGDSTPSGLAAIASGIQDRVAKAGGKRGQVQFSLVWHSMNDVDLHVVTPQGEHISYRNRTSRCEGELDVDMNVSPTSETPVENIRWLGNTPRAGRYTVVVHEFNLHTAVSTDKYQLLASLGDETEVIDDTVGVNKRISVHRFRYYGRGASERQKRSMQKELDRLQEVEERQAGVQLRHARSLTSPERERERNAVLNQLIFDFPHTDAAIEAMQILEGDGK